MSDVVFTVILLAIPVTYVTAIYVSNRRDDYLRKFNELYHADNIENPHAKELLALGSFPFHAFSESDVEVGIEKDMEFLRKQDVILDGLNVGELSDVSKAFDSYLKGDISSVTIAKRIAEERGYKI